MTSTYAKYQRLRFAPRRREIEELQTPLYFPSPSLCLSSHSGHMFCVFFAYIGFIWLLLKVNRSFRPHAHTSGGVWGWSCWKRLKRTVEHAEQRASLIYSDAQFADVSHLCSIWPKSLHFAEIWRCLAPFSELLHLWQRLTPKEPDEGIVIPSGCKTYQVFCQLLSPFVAPCFLISGWYKLHTGREKISLLHLHHSRGGTSSAWMRCWEQTVRAPKLREQNDVMLF